MDCGVLSANPQAQMKVDIYGNKDMIPNFLNINIMLM